MNAQKTKIGNPLTYQTLSLLLIIIMLTGCRIEDPLANEEPSSIDSSEELVTSEEMEEVTLPESLDGLIALLEEGSVLERILAARKIVFMEDRDRAVPALARNLYHNDFEVREAVAETLGELKTASIDAVPFLIMTLFDPSVSVREASAIALGNIGDPRAIPALARCLSAENDPDYYVAMGAAFSIQQIVGITLVDPPHRATSKDKNGIPQIVIAGREWWDNDGNKLDWLRNQ